MFKLKRLLFSVGIIGLLSIILVGCGSNESVSDVKASEGLKISAAALNNYPPLIYKKDGQLTGFEYELLQAIAQEENLDIEFKEMKFDGFIPGLQSGQVDLATSTLMTDERKKVVDFSDVFFNSGIVLVVANDSPIQSFEDLKGKTIVATQGSITLEVAKQLAEEYGAETRPLKETDALFLDVENGNADALTLNSPTVEYRLKLDGDNAKFRIVGDHLTNDEHAFSIQKGNDDLREKINSGLKKIKENGKYDEVHAKWFGK